MADVRRGSGWKITTVPRETEASGEGLDEATWQRAAEQAKEQCPVSGRLKPGLDSITLAVRLKHDAQRFSDYLNMCERDKGVHPWEFLLGAALGLCIATLGCAPAQRTRLVVGMELNYPPFEMIAPNGQPAGISVDLARALSDYLHREVQIENIPFDGLIPALKTGKIHLIISSMTATPERAQSIAFSEPYLRTGLCLLANRRANIHSIEQADQPGYTIAVKQGTTGQLYAQAHLRRARVLVLEKENACVLEVVQDKAQAFIYDQISVLKQWQLHRDTTEALLKPFHEEDWAIGLRRGDDALRARVNAFLGAYQAEGGFRRLGDQYLKEQREAFQELGVPFGF